MSVPQLLCAYANSTLKQCAMDYLPVLIRTPDWEVIVAGFGMFFMAFATGANDVANTMGNLVGCKVLPVHQALLLGSIADFLGAITLGFSFKDSISIKVGNPFSVGASPNGTCWQNGYTNSLQYEYVNGMVAALFSGAIFVMIATALRMPVSTTHSVICGVIGMTLVNVGSDCFNMSVSNGIFSVVLSWVLGPLFAGIMSVIAYTFTNRFILNSSSPRYRALLFLPWFYALGIFSVSTIIFLKSRLLADISKDPTYQQYLTLIALGISALVAIVVASVVSVFLVPHVRGLCPSLASAAAMQAQDKLPTVSPFAPCTELGVREYTALNSLQFANLLHLKDDYACALGDDHINAVGRTSMELIADAYCLTDEQIDAHFAMKYALLFASVLGSFLHGATDVGNSTIPMQAIWTISHQAYTWNGTASVPNMYTGWTAPYWFYLIAGAGGFIGINLFGRPVLDTLARGLSIVNVHRGFCMEIGTITTLALANVLGLPVSSTYCAVSSVVCVSLAHYGREHFEGRKMAFIVMSWVLTLPVTMGMASGFTALLNQVLKAH
ncbi:inorganic phosphate transporter [Thraustotheca clavata]|uniref:Phosphate transporter n=1 Tax=Thraustotheca clavata TaxID=74557 RepID=A0A1V9ZMI2_9STRA|nr:inorganic phosphate transporter [Thraustotheca clavata]